MRRVLIKAGHVVSMDASVGDLVGADIQAAGSSSFDFPDRGRTMIKAQRSRKQGRLALSPEL